MIISTLAEPVTSGTARKDWVNQRLLSHGVDQDGLIEIMSIHLQVNSFDKSHSSVSEAIQDKRFKRITEGRNDREML